MYTTLTMYKPHRRTTTFPKWLTILFILVGLVFAYDLYLFRRLSSSAAGDQLVNVSYSSLPTPAQTPSAVAGVASPTSTPSPTPLPAQAMVELPFLVQAPHAVWDAYHEETCEEASLLMVAHFLNKTPIASLDDGDAELHALTDYEDSAGMGVSITVQQLNEVAKGHYGLTTGRVKTAATVDDIKRELAAGKPVIFPAAGRLLPNPFFKQPGPVYHMLVIKGYDKDGFITNDPGIRQGYGFRYSFEALDKALHNWDASDINQGEKAYLVFD